MTATAPSFSEDRRQVEHLIPIGFAFLLPYLDYGLALLLCLLAILHALYFSPRWIRVTTREEERVSGFSRGKLYYALTVLVLLLIFRDRLYLAAGVWAILAAGDSFSNLVGRRLTRPRLFYNPDKTLSGLVTFWATGGLAAWGCAWWNLPSAAPFSPGRLLACSLLASLFCALGESLPNAIDDNLVIGWIGAATFPLLLSAAEAQWPATRLWLHALIVNILLVVIAQLFRWISRKATLLAFLFGVLIYGAMGRTGYLLIVSFLVLGSVATQLGMARKKALSLAEANSGQRGVSKVLAKGLVPFVTACFFFWIDHTSLRLAYSAALAAATFDTVSTEIGQWLGRRAFSLATLKTVPAGTEGALSLPGTMAGMLGALAIALLSLSWGWLPPGALVFILAGAVGANLFESILGSRLSCRTAYKGETLNLYNTLFGACAAPLLWSLFS